MYARAPPVPLFVFGSYSQRTSTTLSVVGHTTPKVCRRAGVRMCMHACMAAMWLRTEQIRMPRLPRLHSYGLHSYGQYGYGLCSYGLYSYGDVVANRLECRNYLARHFVCHSLNAPHDIPACVALLCCAVPCRAVCALSLPLYSCGGRSRIKDTPQRPIHF